jgi:hypothetical protein
MRRSMLLLLGIALVTGLVSWLGSRYGAAIWSHGTVMSQMPFPEDGKVTGGIYVNDYFDLSYPLPEGWSEGVPGPDPSDSGYYVLGELSPQMEPSATILIAAQDMFFTSKPHANVAGLVDDLREAMSGIDGMMIDREPTEVRVGARLFHRMDFSGVGLYRATFSTGIRCHAVSLNLTARDPGLLANLASSVEKLSSIGKRHSGPPVPYCIENYAVPENLLQRVEPVSVGPKFTSIPVRIIIGTAGRVKHIHVIRATAEQRKSIEDALRQWKFKPYGLNGRTVEIETGLVFRFGTAEK